MNDYEHPMDLMQLPCGGIAAFDIESGISYRCMHCFAVVGSIGMSKHCKDEIQKYDNWKELGGEDWDYKIPDDYMNDYT